MLVVHRRCAFLCALSHPAACLLLLVLRLQAMLNRLGEWEDKLDEEVDLDVLLNDDGSETPSLLQSSGAADHVVDPAQPAHKA